MVQIENQSFTFIVVLVFITIFITRITEHLTSFPSSVSENSWVVFLVDISFFALIFFIVAISMERLQLLQKSE